MSTRAGFRATGRGAALIVLALALRPGVVTGQNLDAIVGSRFDYVVGAGDTWLSLGARFGTDPTVLADRNGRPVSARLAAGERLNIDNRHLVPEVVTDGLVLNIPQRMLFVVAGGRVTAAYPVGVGRPSWPTFVGAFSVDVMEEDPVWDVPPSIQEEQRRAGKPVLTRVPPGPSNPLGKYWLGLSAPNFGIHGTNAPLSIYRFETHGCIRLNSDDIADLWRRVTTGMPGQSVYEPVLMRMADGALMLEAHPDIYRRAADALATVQGRAAASGWTDGIEWPLVVQILQRRDGTPHRIDRNAP